MILDYFTQKAPKRSALKSQKIMRLHGAGKSQQKWLTHCSVFMFLRASQILHFASYLLKPLKNQSFVMHERLKRHAKDKTDRMIHIYTSIMRHCFGQSNLRLQIIYACFNDNHTSCTENLSLPQWILDYRLTGYAMPHIRQV